MNLKTKLIVALDVDSLKKAETLVNRLYPQVGIFKVGSQLFTACGPKAIEMVHKKGAKVFLDLKLYDIPNTVAYAAKAATKLGVFMFDLHIQGGREMMQAAVKVIKETARTLKIKRPKLIGITVLTSNRPSSIIKTSVLRLARQARLAGLDGVVCSAQEAETVRKRLGKNFIIITPGIRLHTDKKQDQKRTATPQEAIKAGSDYLVVGRPILEAKDPLLMAKEIINSNQ